MLTSPRVLLASLAFALLASCDKTRPPQRPAPARAPAPTPAPAPAPARPAVDASAAAPEADASTAVAAAVGDAGDGVRVYRVGDLNCIRDPARERLGASAHGYFGSDRIELEVRNVRHGCRPGPTFTATVEGNALHVRYDAPTREALGRCACRHDQFLQIVGVPRGNYEVDVAPMLAGDAGAPIATGRVTASATGR
ncbi:MAG: hypothetical protein R3A48_04130 [Polyangiales bacterium]